MVLEKGLETRLSRVAQSTFNTKRNNAPFRHLLLYGKLRLVSAVERCSLLYQYSLAFGDCVVCRGGGGVRCKGRRAYLVQRLDCA